MIPIRILSFPFRSRAAKLDLGKSQSAQVGHPAFPRRNDGLHCGTKLGAFADQSRRFSFRRFFGLTNRKGDIMLDQNVL